MAARPLESKDMTLELLGLRYLRFIRKCPLVTLERGICMGDPDVFGVTSARYCIEIEIKRSASDFRANAQKWHVRHREEYLGLWPTYFYYMVPEKLQPKVEHLLPCWAGLMVQTDQYSTNGNPYFPMIVREAPKNKEARKVSIKDLVRMATRQANTLISLKTSIDSFVSKSTLDLDYWGPEFQI
jgi:hypothetical protein